MRKKGAGKRADGTIWINDPFYSNSDNDFISVDECTAEIERRKYKLQNTNGLRLGERYISTTEIMEHYMELKQAVLRLKGTD